MRRELGFAGMPTLVWHLGRGLGGVCVVRREAMCGRAAGWLVGTYLGTYIGTYLILLCVIWEREGWFGWSEAVVFLVLCLFFIPDTCLEI